MASPHCFDALVLWKKSALELELRTQALKVAPDCRDSKNPAVTAIGRPAVLLLEPPVDLNRVPLFRVADIKDADVIVHAPEERHRIERLAPPEHIACRGLPLTLGDDPVLDPNTFTAVEIGPPRDVAGGEDPGIVSRYSLTTTPRSTSSPAFSARPSAGRTPTPTTTRSAVRFSPVCRVAFCRSIAAAVMPR